MKTPVVAFTYVPLDNLKQRIVVVYASAAAVVILLGLAFGAGRKDATRVSEGSGGEANA